MTNAAARAEYEAAICKQLASAEIVRFKEVLLGDWRPTTSHCHENVDTWLRATPGHCHVRGWVYLKQHYDGSTVVWELTAHSVVRDEKGNLFDITPIRDGNTPIQENDERKKLCMRFVGHIGDEELFWRYKNANPSIYCPTCQ